MGRPVPEEEPPDQRLGDGLRSGDRDRDLEVSPDRLVPANEHIDNELVDAVVLAPDRNDTDLGVRLAETVHAAFALLVARRVPSEVVVDHCVEVVLEVDALRKAIGGDEQSGRKGGEASDFGLALVTRQLARHSSDLDALHAQASA